MWRWGMLNKVIQLTEWMSNMLAIKNQTNHTCVLFKSKIKSHDVEERELPCNYTDN